MMRIPRLLLLPALGLIVIVLVGFAISTARVGATASSNSSSSSRMPVGIARFAAGLVPPPGANLADLSSITFSDQDVKTYVLTHGFYGGAVVPGHTLKITSIQLLTRDQVDAQDHAGLEAYSSIKWVYVVRMQGPFYTAHFSRPPGAKVPATVLTGFEIFDAHTGDRIGWGS